VFEYDPVKVDLYLTNLGIIGEIPDTGKLSFYISHDSILEYSPHEAGILIGYLDANSQFSESIIFVEDRNAWINSMYELHARMGGRQI
jgi:hypothetical protein